MSRSRRWVPIIAVGLLLLVAVPAVCADTTDPTVTVDEPETQVKDTVTLSAEVSDDTAIQFGTCEWCISTSDTTCTSDWTSDNVTETAPSITEDQGQVDSLADETALTSLHDRLTQSFVAGADQTQSAETDDEQDFASAGGAELDVKQDSDTSSSGASTYGNRYAGQYFEPTTSGDLLKMEMYIKRYEYSSLSDDLEVRLYAADGSHKPTGSLLASTIIAKADTSTDGSWVNATFASPYTLTSGNGYVVYIKTENGGGDADNHYRWRGCAGGADCYDEGDFLFTSNGGSTWYVYDNDDRAFRAWIAGSGANTKLSQSFTAGGTYTMDRVALVLSRDGTPSESLNVSIYSDTDDDDEPDSLLSKVSVGSGDVGASAQWVIASGLSASLTSGSQYCIVLEVADADTEVWSGWGSDTAADTYTGGKFLTNAGGAGWSDTDANADRAFIITNGKGVYNAEKVMLQLRRFYPVLDQSQEGYTHTSSVYGSRHYGQTFTPGETAYLPQVELYIYEYGTGSSHELNVSVYSTDGSGYPTGAPLVSRSFLRSEIPSSEAWFEVVFPDPPYLTLGTKYAVVLKCPDCPNDSNSMKWRYKFAASDSYSGGQLVKDTGSGWTDFDSGTEYYDQTFRTYYNDEDGRWIDEGNDVDGAGSAWIYSGVYHAAAFRPQNRIKAHEVDLEVSKTGSPTGNLIVEIRNISRDDDDCKNPEECGDMTNTTLATANVTVSDIDTSYGWITATFDSTTSWLSAHKLYAIVIRQDEDGGDSSNRYNWRRSSDTVDVYTRGNYFYTTDSGGSWTTASDYSYNFKVFNKNSNTPTALYVSLHDDDDYDGNPDAPSGGTLDSSSTTTSAEAVIKDRSYRGQVFTPNSTGYVDRVELLLHGSASAGGSDLLVSIQGTAGDTDVLAYSYTTATDYGNVYGTRYGANTFYTKVGTKLDRAGVYIKKVGSPNNLTVEVRAANPTTGQPVEGTYLARGTIHEDDVTESYQWLYVNITDEEAPTLTAGTWYTVVLKQELDGGDYDNRYVWGAYGSAGDGIFGWYWNGTDWLADSIHTLKVYVDGPVDFMPRENIYVEARVPVSDLPLCAAGCEEWVPVRFDELIELTSDVKYAIVLREEHGSGEVYWQYNATVTDDSTYLIWRSSGNAWNEPARTYNVSQRDYDYNSHGYRVYFEDNNRPAYGTIDINDIPISSADWVESTLSGYGVTGTTSKVISLDARYGGVDDEHYVIWAGAPTDEDAYEPGSSGSGSVTGSGGSSSNYADRGIRSWDSNSTDRSCSAVWNTEWVTNNTASLDWVQDYYIHFRMKDEAGLMGNGTAGSVIPVNIEVAIGDPETSTGDVGGE